LIIPVCAPALLGGHGPLARPEDVLRFPLLQLTSRPQAWTDWLRAAGVAPRHSPHGPRFEEFHMVIQAAIAGLGLAVLPRFLIQEELGSGRLVVAHDHPVTSDQAYHLVHPDRKADLYKVSVFRDWLVSQCVGQG
jgi:DNA-binding transcriptional LysR family regulator